MKKIILFFILITVFTFSKESIKISNDYVKQGEFFIVEFPKDKDYTISFPNSHTKIKSFIERDSKKAFVPVHYSTPVGAYTLKVLDGKRLMTKKLIKVKDGNFKKSYITVNKTMQKKRSSSNMKAMTNKSGDAKSNPSSDKLWEENFILPVTDSKYQKISSPFGAMRFVNNKVAGYHSGIDFPVPIGTPLVATNNGRVVLAEKLTTTGNTIIIDHGMNIFSAYAHMSELSVKSGDIVKKGQTLGKSGNTGFTTGPHLHFTISVGTTFINPNIFLNNKILEN